MEPKKSIVLPLALGVLLLGVIFGGSGYYLANSNQTSNITVSTPTPTQSLSTPTTSTNSDSTADWKVYTNSQVNISFKYPADMSFKDSTAMLKGDTAQPVWIELDKTVTNPCGLENPPGCSKDGYSIQFRAIESGDEAVEGFCHDTDTSLTIGGVQGKIASQFHQVGEEGSTVSQFACVTSGKYTYHFGFYVDKDYSTTNKKYFSQFLDTVKFTK